MFVPGQQAPRLLASDNNFYVEKEPRDQRLPIWAGAFVLANTATSSDGRRNFSFKANESRPIQFSDR